MFCTNCGIQLDRMDNFCAQCGKAVRRPETSEPEKPKTHLKPVIKKVYTQQTPAYTPAPTASLRNKSNESKDQKKREEHRAELRKLLEKEQQREITDQELFEAEHWLRNYAELMLDLGIKEVKRQDKLKENPKGFHLKGEGYSCFVCGTTVSNEETWYDKHGIKCLMCQSAIDKKIIPARVASDKDSWYSIHDFEHSFFITKHGVKKLVKEGLLKPRIIPGSTYQLFLIKDHQDVLPPKNLTQWPTIKFKKDGEEWYQSEPWFMHSDPKEILKWYKIIDYYGVLEPKHIKQSFPQLSYQINKAAKPMLKVNSIDKKTSKESDLAEPTKDDEKQ